MKPGGNLKRTRLKQRSDRRVAEDENEYLDARMAVNVRDMGRCQAEHLVPTVRCAGPNTPHHVHPTGHQGPRCEVANIITACARHHAWIHANTWAAKQLGLLAGGGVTYTEAQRIREAKKRAGWPL